MDRDLQTWQNPNGILKEARRESCSLCTVWSMLQMSKYLSYSGLCLLPGLGSGRLLCVGEENTSGDGLFIQEGKTVHLLF